MSKRVHRGRRIVLGAVAAAASAVAALYTVSWLRSGPVEPSAFFAGWPDRDGVLVVAHQGGEALRPSNTMVAFEHAVAVGADVLDTDMHRTADGELVLIHDDTVDRTSDGTGAVRDLTLAELRELDFGHTFSPADGGDYPERDERHPIVTVEELFERFDDGLRFGIEIKQTEPEAATELCRLIRRFGYEDRVLVSSFTDPNMAVFRRACPTVATSATESEVRTFYVLHRLGLIGLVDPGYEALQVPEYSGDFFILSEGFIADARTRGLPVVPWTINDADTMDRLLGLGVAGINTDHPDRLLERLEVRTP